MLSKLHEKSLQLLLLKLNDSKFDYNEETELGILLSRRTFDWEIDIELF